MTNQLTDINVSEITLCKMGKNGLQFIAKAADGAPRIEVPIRKTDPVKKIAVGVVYEPDKPDADEDTATAEEIEKAAWSALKNQAVVNKKDHGSDPVGAFLAESYIVKAGDPDEFPQGAWAIVIKVEDDALWAEIEKGELSAFSMGGVAQKNPVVKTAYVDASVFTYGLKDSLALLQAVAQSLGEVVEKLAGLEKSPEADAASVPAPAAESPAMEDLQKKVEEFKATVGENMEKLQETVNKIAEATTDGRMTSPDAGSPAIDPGKY